MIQIFVKDEKVEGVYSGNNIREGWIKIDDMPEPEQRDGYIPIPYYRDGKIVYEYEVIPEMPEEEILIPEMTYEEQVVAKIRERYSIDDELAILRQRYTKPDEFEAYNEYAEQCKADVKKGH